ncbi:hypothetical protein [Tuwongella immobilis]|uniref:Uncharacterized protein n=1 Tax=Tuwongella immobilis TaxID=692036 RepID=A0A6C2YHM0_9BACT|nr:hypothetical protein [Tuwongella immobilis]VIP00986.1 Uncharacterized protein OS=Planctomyces maris DSM 8797 GN=PM8797T_00884 PE=4 SV=1 [Tuwongella immobilis]VTR97395.1 Uncharacterized protein OS=Planctomyces maris DSM 8797 GN=PM8797T_00884 PE=4 SV=1 [Tuwongella immobilis]
MRLRFPRIRIGFRMGQLFVMGWIGIGLGCHRETPLTAIEPPLTLESWKTLPISEKYEIDTLERLKLSDPKFQNQRQWDQFTRTVLLPAKRRDLPPATSH